MREEILKSGRDAFLVAVPLVFLLFVGVFRLDELFGGSGKVSKPRRFGGGQDEDGEPILSDPDGELVPARRQRK
jgi:hypothetical protein